MSEATERAARREKVCRFGGLLERGIDINDKRLKKHFLVDPTRQILE